LKDIHEKHHLGVDRTLYLARLCFSSAEIRRDVERVMRSCGKGNSIDPHPIQWQEGSLEVKEN
jgi:hypothetical protein